MAPQVARGAWQEDLVGDSSVALGRSCGYEPTDTVWTIPSSK